MVWERELDVYGSPRKGNHDFVPFLYQGQYVDVETGLAYNRFRYYDPQIGNFISQDPIGLQGRIALYRYVLDSNSWIDPLGLTPWGDMRTTFRDWWDNHATEDLIKSNKSSVQAALRGMNGGKNHEMFPVSVAAKAKELGFSLDELEKLTIKIADIEFVNVTNRHGLPVPDGPHHGSSAVRHFHNKLIDALKGANTKAEALAIIQQHHDNHMRMRNNH
ncbi:RHS repeat-associated core domain-containing protein [Elizabethkingia argenteiflava]|uniref:RHS repeat-associated core domain-containing protein n=1 Tax=Elizabethkingia argenteiflava TaxID=2681556 RepID=UPI00159C236B|nr:RHS repeat-associated core domain-containing protein [Elizabethkingia argenteiflava]